MAFFVLHLLLRFLILEAVSSFSALLKLKGTVQRIRLSSNLANVAAGGSYESVRASRTLGRPPHAQHAIAAISEGEAWWTIMAYGNNTVQFLIA